MSRWIAVGGFPGLAPGTCNLLTAEWLLSLSLPVSPSASFQKRRCCRCVLCRWLVNFRVALSAPSSPLHEQVIKCCHHYEKKCAGKYSSKTLAARYLYDLSREVQDLVRVLQSRDAERERRVQYLERLVKEWSDTFAAPGPELQAVGISASNSSPAAVAERLCELHSAAASAEQAAADTAAKAAQEVSELRSGMASAAAAAAAAHEGELATLRGQRDAALAAERARADAAEQSVAELRGGVAHAVAVQTEQAVNSAVSEVRAEAADREAALQHELAAAQAALRETQEALEASRSEAKDEAQRTSAALEALQQDLQAQRTAASEAEAAARQAAKRAEGRHAEALQELRSNMAARTDARRVEVLEQHAMWLARRVTELQVLADELQRALAAATGHASGSNAADGAVAGVPPAPPAAHDTPVPHTLQPVSAQHRPDASKWAGWVTKGPATAAAPPPGGEGGDSVTYWYTRPAKGGGCGCGGGVGAAESLFRRFAPTHEPTPSALQAVRECGTAE